mgnify:CR=1 FL=1
MNQDGFLAPGEKEHLRLSKVVQRRIAGTLQAYSLPTICNRCGTCYVPADAAGKRQCRLHPHPINVERQSKWAKQEHGPRAWRWHYSCCGDPADAGSGSAAEHASGCRQHIRYSEGYGDGGSATAAGCTHVDHTDASHVIIPVASTGPFTVRFSAPANNLVNWVRVEPEFVVDRLLVARNLPLTRAGHHTLFGTETEYYYIGSIQQFCSVLCNARVATLRAGGIELKVPLDDAYVHMAARYRMPNNAVKAPQATSKKRKNPSSSSSAFTEANRRVMQRISSLADIGASANKSATASDDSLQGSAEELIGRYVKLQSKLEDGNEYGGLDEPASADNVSARASSAVDLQDDTTMHFDPYYDAVPTQTIHTSQDKVERQRASMNIEEAVSRILPMSDPKVVFYPFYVWTVVDAHPSKSVITYGSNTDHD